MPYLYFWDLISRISYKVCYNLACQRSPQVEVNLAATRSLEAAPKTEKSRSSLVGLIKQPKLLAPPETGHPDS